ncbi:hypothetical protein PAECIP111802_07091 [Paenibacillus allorhizosphaerae]|uniref:Uncharacterized protein n=1 Tax=Paenibacillus allorhizosphaerae TaxID=2849866 RepID=A0ABM8VU33_9BACL|nr:hypothetical protein PAECIP111802_07091 [Paenibacillus allorhizosphaerae]
MHDGYIQVREHFAEYVIDQPVAPMFHRPMSAYVNRMLLLNFSLVRMIEPQLSPKTVVIAGMRIFRATSYSGFKSVRSANGER